MSPSERAGIGQAVAQQIDEAVARVLQQCDERIAAGQVIAMVADSAGALQLVQRSGSTLTAPLPVPPALPDVPALVDARLEVLRAEVLDILRSEVHAAVARSFEVHTNAPAWSPTAVYTEGQLVQCYGGRTYRVAKGVIATTGKEPGEHRDQWERVGTLGLRVHKSRPPELEPGDVFTESDSRFMHDGQGVILLVPKAAKVSDIERAVKTPYGMAQAVQAQLVQVREQMQAQAQAHQAQVDALQAQLDALLAPGRGAA